MVRNSGLGFLNPSYFDGIVWNAAETLRAVDRAAREECARLVDSALLDFPAERSDYAEGYATARRAALRAIKG